MKRVLDLGSRELGSATSLDERLESPLPFPHLDGLTTTFQHQDWDPPTPALWTSPVLVLRVDTLSLPSVLGTGKVRMSAPGSTDAGQEGPWQVPWCQEAEEPRWAPTLEYKGVRSSS